MSDLTNIIKKVLRENRGENYMFFSNLKQMRRQIDVILEMDQDMVDQILQNGHDWADDHITEAKTNMDQVFDFLINETEEDVEDIDYEMSEGKKKRKKITNYVLVVSHLLNQDMTYIQVHTPTDTRYKCVQEMPKVWTEKKDVQENIVQVNNFYYISHLNNEHNIST